MPKLPYDRIGPGPLGPAKILADMINAAKEAQCRLNRNHYNWVQQNGGRPNPVAEEILRILCPNDPPLPPPDQPALPGGKCVCVDYQIDAVLIVNGVSTPITEVQKGPVTVVGWYTLSNGNQAFGYEYLNQTCTQTIRANVVANVTNEDVSSGRIQARVTAITRVGGGPDDCGGQLPQYKPTVPTIPEINFTAPIEISPGITVITPVFFIRPTLNINLQPKINFNLNPTFNFSDLNLNLRFDIDGVEINNSFEFNFGGQYTLPDPRPNPPRLPPGEDVDVDLTEVYRRLERLRELAEDIKECACEPDTVLKVQTLGSGQSGTFVLPPLTKFVILNLVTIPGNRKFQSGLTAPDVVYAGWSWFGYQTEFLGDREPVDGQRKAYFAEEGAERFSFTLYKEFVGLAIAYYEEEVPPP